jgi:very-short-patch-repair endonuclease
MRGGQVEVARLLEETGGVLRRRDHPTLAGVVDRLLRDGRLVAVLPGIYAEPGRADDLEVRLRALQTWRPDAVVTGSAAAKLTFWPELSVGTVTAALPRLDSRPHGYRIEKRQVPAEQVVGAGGLRVTAPALTALDLCSSLGGEAIDAVLRSRCATLADLHRALAGTAGRRGHGGRRRLRLDSRDEPWSEAEREAHRLLRAAGIEGWQTNVPVALGLVRYYLDIAFPEHRLALEIDGRAFHDDPGAFERDRARQNDLVLAGWTVLRFTWRMLVEHPEAFIAAVLQALR